MLAAENLVPYSLSEPAIFKAEKLTPVKHLKFLVRDHPVSYYYSLEMKNPSC